MRLHSAKPKIPSALIALIALSALRRVLSFGGVVSTLLLLLLGCLSLLIAGCGGGSSSPAQGSSALSGNWQFTLAAPADGSFNGDPTAAVPNSVLQGGFLVQTNGTISGQVVFSIFGCNSGTAAVTGTISGQMVSLTATLGATVQNQNGDYVPGTQTITLSNGQLSADNSTIQGSNATYTVSPTGYYYQTSSQSYKPCGVAQSAGNLSWSALAVPPITGAFQGFFHSSGITPYNGQVFPVSGSLQQGANTGASSATVTGNLLFTGYPCFSKASVNGEISGQSLVLQLFNSSSGANSGQIGGVGNDAGGTYPVTFTSTPNGYVLQNLGANSTAYVVATNSCPLPSGTVISKDENGDAGNVCLGFAIGNSGTSGTVPCTEPITVTPASLTFPAQSLGLIVRTRQVLTVNNVQPAGSSPFSLSPLLVENDSTNFYPSGGDFNGLPNFTEQDTCGSPLAPQQSCTVTITFAPQESCPWLPYGSVPLGLDPTKCPAPFNPNVTPKSLLSAVLQLNTGTSSPDGDSTFAIPIKGAGMSALVPSTPRLDFGAVDLGVLNLSQQLTQSVSFTNQSTSPVQILPALSGSALTSFQQACNDTLSALYYLPRPPQSGVVPGLVVVATNGANINVTPVQQPPSGGPPTAGYYCDFDPTTGQSSFQIVADSCSGAILGPSGSQAPSDTCSLTIMFAPQPDSYLNFPDNATNSGLDFFLELNTSWCGDATDSPQPDCEVDSGRFPVELTANPQGALRMAPAAGLDFGTVLKGTTSTPMTITLTNDQKDSVTVNFTGKSLTGTDYLETDNGNCPTPLNSGSSCTLSFTFSPTVSGYDPGSLTIGYTATNSSGVTTYNLTQYIYLRGIGQ